MDITLERILSLLPHKADGTLVRGAKKEFAEGLGFSSGDIVSMWLKGASTSYLNYLYEIAAKYNVSVAWLKGETDDPAPVGTPAAVNADEEQEIAELLEMLRTRPECRMLLSTAKGATKAEIEANVKFIEALRGYKRSD